MSIPNAYTSGQQAEGYNPHLADLFRIRQMERLLNQALEELGQVKARLSRIEMETAIQNDDEERTEKALNSHRLENAPSIPPHQITEIKQLAEMAKRFK